MTFKARPQFVIIEPDALKADISLEALGLLAHISAHQDSDELEQRFPDYDVESLLDELAAAGLITTEPNSPEAGGFVYVIQAGPSFKIGVTKNVHRRLKQIKRGAAHPPIIVWKKHFDDCMKVERWLHARLGVFRTHGEWFVCPHTEIDAALAKYGASE
jgi:T5orf172 domain